MELLEDKLGPSPSCWSAQGTFLFGEVYGVKEMSGRSDKETHTG